MRYALLFSIFAALLGGCVVVPSGYGDHRDGYYQERGYSRGDGYYRDRDYSRGDGGDGYSYRRQRGYQGDPFQDHGR